MKRKAKISRKTKETNISVEVNIDGKTGYLSDLGDVNKMATDTLSLLKDKDKLNAFKANALAHAYTFDLPNILPQYETVYQALSCKMKS